MPTEYGELDYELPRAIKLVEDIELHGCLKQGGEQYPNGACLIDAAQQLRSAVNAVHSGYSRRSGGRTITTKAA